MENVLESIRAAIAPDATPEVRAAGAVACRAVLTALESTPGQPLTSAATTPPSQIASVVSALRGAPVEQVLDLAIARLRAALPAGTEVPAVTPLRFNLVSPNGRRV
jgi:hypothetical protein